jgi:hypothetical protein
LTRLTDKNCIASSVFPQALPIYCILSERSQSKGGGLNALRQLRLPLQSVHDKLAGAQVAQARTSSFQLIQSKYSPTTGLRYSRNIYIRWRKINNQQKLFF